MDKTTWLLFALGLGALAVRKVMDNPADLDGLMLIGITSPSRAARDAASAAARAVRLNSGFSRVNWANRLKVPDILRFHPQVMAFMRLIREGESSQAANAYATVYGGGLVPDLIKNPHPCKRWVPSVRSTATGAYQVMCDTWSEMFGGENPIMSIVNQERAALRAMAWRGALPAVLSGDLNTAYRMLKEEWTSLPGASENKIPKDRFRAVFVQYGGVVMAGQ